MKRSGIKVGEIMKKTTKDPDTTVNNTINEVVDIKADSINKNKYNPDVMENYEKIKDYKIGDIEYTNETWKGITGDKMDFKVDCSESFVIPIEKVDPKKLDVDFMEEYNIREQERLKIEEKNRIIKEKMLETVMQMVDEICDDDVDPEEVVTYDILKLEGTNKGIETQHDDYNSLLDAIKENL